MDLRIFIEWLFISPIFHFGCPDYVDIERNICIETALEFALGWNGCFFTLRNAQASLNPETHTCLRKCNIRIESLEDGEWSYGNFYQYFYQLKNVDLRIDSLSKIFKRQCDSSYTEKTLKIICNTGSRIDLSSNLCTSSTECEISKRCLRSSTEQIGICVCRYEYISFENECLVGNLTLNSTCQRSEQCSGTVGSVCQKNKCVCGPGFVPLNSSSCFSPDISDGLCTSHKGCVDESKYCSMKGQVGICICKSGFIGFGNECLKGNLNLNESCQRNEQCSLVPGSVCENNRCVPPLDGNSQASVQDQKGKEDSVVGLMFGAVIGGLFLGITLTVLGIIIIKNIRNGKSMARKKRDQTAVVFNNTSYETEREADQKQSTVQRTYERKVVNVPPFAHSMDLPVTKNTYTNKSSMANSHDVNDDVYNHLHEKEEDSDVDETYDHAHENNNGTMEESAYSNLNTGRRYMGPGVSATEDNDYDEREPPGDYCSLEKQ